jgi:MoaA/NifB/PqqE/SkfB family radical SAM enzyme
MLIEKIDYKFKEFNRVLQIEWTLGNTCNYNCSYCLPILHNNSFPWINLDESKTFIDKLHNHYSKLGITDYIWKFGGGEPTLYKDFAELCVYINSKPNNYIIPITNGSRKLHWWQEHAKNFFAVHFSIHPEFVDPNHIVAVCDNLIEQKIDSICHVMMKPNDWNRCLEIVEVLKNSQHKQWGIQAKPLHHTWELDTAEERDLYPYTAEQKQIFQAPIRAQNRISPRVDSKLNRDMYMVTEEGIKDFDPYWAVTHDIVDWSGFKCDAGINRIYINYDKRMYLGAGCRVELNNFVGKKYNEEFEFPTKSIICNQRRCVCIADVQVPKNR